MRWYASYSLSILMIDYKRVDTPIKKMYNAGLNTYIWAWGV